MIKKPGQEKFMLKGIKGIIFDFDGVIAESNQVKTDAFVELYSDHGADIVQRVLNHHEANGGISRFEKIQYYHKTFLNIDLSEKEIMELADRFSKLVVNEVIDAPYVPGALEYIKKNHERYKLFISTGTPTKEINEILERKNIAHYFMDVYGSPKKKKDHIMDIRIKNNLKPDEIIFFGDSKTDIEAAFYHNVQIIIRMHKHNSNYFNSNHHKIIRDFSEIEMFKMNQNN